nr:DUF987 family protein [Vibrio cholerae]
MKTIQIIKRSDAMRIAKDHPVATIEKYCSGKYQWHGNQEHYIGRQEKVPERILALWVERRSDRNGAYAQVMSLADS